jgi:cyclophilin family peptidyl-prolyl cis-trans isomerase/protein-disulfide isomerase
MHKKLMLATAMIFLFLVACQPAVAPSPAATQTGEGYKLPTLAPTSTSLPDATPTEDLVLTAGEGCTVVTQRDQPTPVSPFRAIDDSDWSVGPAEAAVTFIEYTDFQCPFCSQIFPVLEQLKQDFPDDLRLIFRHFPLPAHDKAIVAAHAAEAAGLQGEFWGMHDALFSKQSEWVDMSEADFRSWLADQATALALDLQQFNTDIDSEAVAQRVQRDQDESTALGLPGTPTLIINGQYYGGPNDLANLSAIISLIKLEKQQFTACPPLDIDASHQYRATLKTEKGDIVIELYPDQAPIAVNNFIFLAQNHWYDGITFFRVIPDFVAQTGDPTNTGFGGPGYAFVNETSPDLTFDGPGVVGMANAGPDSNGSQFFITYSAQDKLNGGYTIFGHVVSGMDVLEQLTPRNPATDPGAPPGDVLLSVTIEEK